MNRLTRAPVDRVSAYRSPLRPWHWAFNCPECFSFYAEVPPVAWLYVVIKGPLAGLCTADKIEARAGAASRHSIVMVCSEEEAEDVLGHYRQRGELMVMNKLELD